MNRKCVRTGAAGVLIRRSLGHHFLYSQILTNQFSENPLCTYVVKTPVLATIWHALPLRRLSCHSKETEPVLLLICSKAETAVLLCPINAKMGDRTLKPLIKTRVDGTLLLSSFG